MKLKKIEYVKQNWELYIFILPAIILIFIFNYIPMYGIQIAFKDFLAKKGILGSPWIGFKHFERFITSHNFFRLVGNTLRISLTGLIVGFPFPIILALLLNQMKQKRFKKIVQTVTYAPHFISTVVMCGMIILFLSPRSGIVNKIINLFGGQSILFLAEANFFVPIYVLSGIWQSAGWGAIIYLAALSGINPELYEAARVDGAGKFRRIIHIDIPGITPTIVILLILSLGGIMSVGFEKAFLLQNSLNLSRSEIIATFTYRVGLIDGQFSFSTAVGLFNTVINFILLVIVNRFSRKVSEVSLW